MAKKIYLSPAAHARDNSTKCPVPCGENIHCNEYMDIVERRLKEVGFDVKRGDKNQTGSTAMKNRTSEANKWKADLYYVAHTNAGGGKYSMTMYHPNSATGKNWANIVHKYRKAVDNGNHKVKAEGNLYEINATNMVCLYDELFFHDNAEDCAWFHQQGGMTAMAEETVKAFCEIFGVEYKSEDTQPVQPGNKTTEYVDVTYQVYDKQAKKWLPNVKNQEDYAGIFSHDVCAIYANLSKGNITYQVHTLNGKWWGEITNRTTYAGVLSTPTPIDAFRVKVDNGHTVHYRAHIKNGNRWLGDITGYDINNSKTGYAGIIGQAIDAIQIWVDPLEIVTEVPKQDEPVKEEPTPVTPDPTPNTPTAPVEPTPEPQPPVTPEEPKQDDTPVNPPVEDDTKKDDNVTPEPSPTPDDKNDDKDGEDEITDNLFLKALKAFIKIFVKWFQKIMKE